MTSAAAAQNSIAKSRSETASSELRHERLEAELARDALAVDRKAGAGERRAAERQAVDAPAAIGEALDVAREHRVVGQQVMAEGDRLRDLQMREARHDRVGVRARRGRAARGAARASCRDSASIAPRSQSRISVATWSLRERAGVQALAGVADQLGQALLDVEVDVLEIARPDELAALRFRARSASCRVRSRRDRRRRGRRCRQHPGVRQRAGDVDVGQALVEIDRRGVALDELGHRLAEAAGPGRPRHCGAGDIALDLLGVHGSRRAQGLAAPPACAGSCRRPAAGVVASLGGGRVERRLRIAVRMHAPYTGRLPVSGMMLAYASAMQRIINQRARAPAAAGSAQPGHDPAHSARASMRAALVIAFCARAAACGAGSASGRRCAGYVEPHLLCRASRAVARSRPGSTRCS